MTYRLNRRQLLKAMGASTLAPLLGPLAVAAENEQAELTGEREVRPQLEAGVRYGPLQGLKHSAELHAVLGCRVRLDPQSSQSVLAVEDARFLGRGPDAELRGEAGKRFREPLPGDPRALMVPKATVREDREVAPSVSGLL